MSVQNTNQLGTPAKDLTTIVTKNLSNDRNNINEKNAVNNILNSCKLSENQNNSNALALTGDMCSDSEEDFDRTTRKLGAHNWIFNYDVSKRYERNCFFFIYSTFVFRKYFGM